MVFILLHLAKDDSAPASPLSSRGENDTLERKERRTSISSHGGEKSMEFIPPTSTVKKNDWVKDEKVSSCMQCHQAFSMVYTIYFYIHLVIKHYDYTKRNVL